MKSRTAATSTLHVFHWDPKFFPPFLEFLDSEFGLENNPILLEGAPQDIQLGTGISVVRPSSGLSRIRQYWSAMEEASRVILHGVFDRDLRFALALRPRLARRCCWVPWGGDLYWATEPATSPKRWMHLALFRRAVKQFSHVLTYLPTDLEVARDHLGFRGAMLPCLMYHSNVVSDRALTTPIPGEASSSDHLKILVGNSATPSNLHDDAFEALQPARDRVEVICPLNYGDPAYREHVIATGRRLFGGQFRPLVHWMPRAQFEGLLSTIDIGVFAHRRQQAMGTTIGLLGMGRQVVLRAGTSQANYFGSLGVSYATLDKPVFDRLHPKVATRNRALIAEHHSLSTLRDNWRDILRYPAR